jgi:hypothetical protein
MKTGNLVIEMRCHRELIVTNRLDGRFGSFTSGSRSILALLAVTATVIAGSSALFSATMYSPQLQWALASPYGIQRDDTGQVWHAGHVTDVLEVLPGTFLVGADQGGVWQILLNGQATPLSDWWDTPDVYCLAQGPDGPLHVFAGCIGVNGNGALWVTESTTADPLHSWKKVAIPNGTGSVLHIVVLPNSRHIVLACQNGVWWSPLPVPTANQAYTWTAASGIPSGVCWSAAEGPNESLVVAVNSYGLYYGSWTLAGVLQMRQASAPQVDQTQMARTSVASSAADRRVIYAAASSGGGWGDGMYCLLRSTDGGQSWALVSAQVMNNPTATALTDAVGNQGGYNNCLAVSPLDTAIVALGWRTGPFLSQDGGQTWRQYGQFGPGGDSNLHEDLHAVYFNGTRLYIGSDGGLAGGDVQTGAAGPPLLNNLSSIYNQYLATLQFYSRGGNFGPYGTFSADDQFAVGGLQDNGTVYTLWRNRAAWHEAAGGDGGATVVLSGTNLLFDSHGDSCCFLPTVTTWNGVEMGPEEWVPPVLVNGTFAPNTQDANGVTGQGGFELFIEPVPAPRLASQYNSAFSILAVAAVADKVFGLFADNVASPYIHWEEFSPLQLDAGDFITAVGSYDGLDVWAGCNSGRIFRLPSGQSPVEITAPAGAGRITHLLLDASQPPALRGYAAATGGILKYVNGSTVTVNQGFWGMLPLPNSPGILDLAVDWNPTTPTLFVATANRVLLTANEGSSWLEVSAGLPRGIHCSGLCLSGCNLFLSTYGRSVWQARIERPSPVLTSDRTGLNDTTPASAYDGSVVTFFQSSYDNWQYLQIDLRCPTDLWGMRRYMTLDGTDISGDRGPQGEGFSYSDDGMNWTPLLGSTTQGWEAYNNYSPHAWDYVPYGWSAWLYPNNPVRARYVRFNWDGNYDALNEVQLGFGLAPALAPQLNSPTLLPDGSLEFTFAGVPGAAFTVLGTSSLSPPINWSVLGIPAEVGPGQFRFIDPEAVQNAARFYRVVSP